MKKSYKETMRQRRWRRNRNRAIKGISIFALLLIGLWFGNSLEGAPVERAYTINGVVNANSNRNTSTQAVSAATSQAPSIEELVRTYSTIYGVDADLVMAVIHVESRGQENAINGSCVGVMQLNTEHSQYYIDGAGVNDLYNTEQNIKAGIWHLSVLIERYEDTNMVLMAYNCGEARAQELWAEGIFETEYTTRVIKNI